jgi:hypothetical protein
MDDPLDAHATPSIGTLLVPSSFGSRLSEVAMAAFAKSWRRE